VIPKITSYWKLKGREVNGTTTNKNFLIFMSGCFFIAREWGGE